MRENRGVPSRIGDGFRTEKRGGSLGLVEVLGIVALEGDGLHLRPREQHQDRMYMVV
jgi:hypothetical protein